MRVLIVEDEPAIADILRRALEQEKFTVEMADDGEIGGIMARNNQYDIILMDNMMPKKSGKELCRELREDGLVTPILMVSVRSETNLKVDLLNAGADDYLVKPFALNELIARVRALLRRPKDMHKEIMEIDDLVIDTKKLIVTRSGKAIVLTKKEYLLLEYMLKHLSIPLSRGMMLENVWDMNTDPFSNTIEAHIRSLRRKIDLPGKRKLIHTVPGIGYKIDLNPESEADKRFQV